MLFNVYVEANDVGFGIAKNVCLKAIFAMVKELSGDENAMPKHGETESDPLYQSAVKYGDKRLIAALKRF